MKITEIEGRKVRMLDEHFSKGDRTFDRVGIYQSVGGTVWYLYKATWKGIGTHYYELFKQNIKKKSNKDTHSDEEYTHTERYPSDSDFGYWAYSLVDEEHCKQYTAKLNLTEVKNPQG